MEDNKQKRDYNEENSQKNLYCEKNSQNNLSNEDNSQNNLYNEIIGSNSNSNNIPSMNKTIKSPFNTNIDFILKPEEHHYICNKCYLFPFIEFKNKKYIKLTCSCFNNKEMSIADFFTNFSYYENFKDNLSNEGSLSSSAIVENNDNINKRLE